MSFESDEDVVLDPDEDPAEETEEVVTKTKRRGLWDGMFSIVSP